MTMQEKKPLSTGMFYMWRCLVAIAHADGKLQKEELDYFEKLFDNLLQYFDLTQEQRDAFADDLYTPQSVDALFSRINEPEPRDILIGFAEELAWLDGVLDAKEEDILNRLHLQNPASHDREQLLGEIRADMARHKAEWDAERTMIRNSGRARNPLFRAVDVVLMKLGIDILN